MSKITRDSSWGRIRPRLRCCHLAVDQIAEKDMNLRPALYLFFVPLLAPAGALAEQPTVPPVPHRTRVLPPGSPSLQPPESAATPLLTRNFRVSLIGKAGEKAAGELSNLTCHPQITFGGPMDDSGTPTAVTVAGLLTEEGESLRFDYQLSFRVAIVSQSQRATPGGALIDSVSWEEYSCQGSLLMKEGTAYDVIRAAGATYSLMIAPETNP